MEHSEGEMGAPPPGFRFFPTEEELISFYLHNKLLTAAAANSNNLSRIMDHIIPVLDIYQFNPWDLPQYSGVVSQDEAEQWFFFIPRQEKEARGGRPNRLTTVGYWKATGSPGFVFSSGNRAIGVKRTMVFYIGRAPNGTKTVWKMNEYKALVASVVSTTPRTAPIHPALMRQEFSLCRVYEKSKCLRAFDRRPCGPVIDDDHRIQGTSQQPPHQNLDQPIMIINPTNLLDEINGGSSSHDLTHHAGIANLPHRLDQAAVEECNNIMEMDADDCENQGALWDYCFHGF